MQGESLSAAADSVEPFKETHGGKIFNRCLIVREQEAHAKYNTHFIT